MGLLLDILLLLCGDSATLGLQEQPLHMFQQITDGVDARMGQLITLALGLGGCWVDQQMALLHPQYHGELSSTAPASSPYDVSSQGKPGSPALISRVWLANMYTLGPALLCCLGEVVGAALVSAIAGERQDQLSHSHDLRDRSPTCHRP